MLWLVCQLIETNNQTLSNELVFLCLASLCDRRESITLCINVSNGGQDNTQGYQIQFPTGTSTFFSVYKIKVEYFSHFYTHRGSSLGCLGQVNSREGHTQNQNSMISNVTKELLSLLLTISHIGEKYVGKPGFQSTIE